MDICFSQDFFTPTLQLTKFPFMLYIRNVILVLQYSVLVSLANEELIHFCRRVQMFGWSMRPMSTVCLALCVSLGCSSFCIDSSVSANLSFIIICPMLILKHAKCQTPQATRKIPVCASVTVYRPARALNIAKRIQASTLSD